MAPDGRSSGSVRRVDGLALWPWNTETRRHRVLPPRSRHCRIVPLSLVLRPAAALGRGWVRGSADAAPEPTGTRADAVTATMSKADRRIGPEARPRDAL